MTSKPDWHDHIGALHQDGTEHKPDWTTVRHADLPPDEPIFDVWCHVCGQSGSFWLKETDINWI